MLHIVSWLEWRDCIYFRHAHDWFFCYAKVKVHSHVMTSAFHTSLFVHTETMALTRVLCIRIKCQQNIIRHLEVSWRLTFVISPFPQKCVFTQANQGKMHGFCIHTEVWRVHKRLEIRFEFLVPVSKIYQITPYHIVCRSSTLVSASARASGAIRKSWRRHRRRSC